MTEGSPSHMMDKKPGPEYRVIVILILVLVAGIAYAFFSRSSSPSPAQIKQSITRVLQADKVLGDALNAGIAREGGLFWYQGGHPHAVAKAIDAYCDQAEHLDFSGCPADFTLEYLRTVKTWRELGAICASLPNSVLSQLHQEYNEMLAGHILTPATPIYMPVKQADKKLKRQWSQVQQLAAKYGVVWDH